MINKIKDFFDVIKYKRQRNTALNMLDTRNSDYIVALETIQTLTKEILNYQKQVTNLKNERKELKKSLEEKTSKKRNDKKV